MARYLVTGGFPLKGEVTIWGNKNSILGLMAATLLTDQPSTLENVPLIADVAVMAQILQSLGATVSGLGTHKLVIDPAKVNRWTVEPELATKVRGSVMCLAPLLSRFGQVRLGFPGGDTIGKRGVNTHLDALNALGAKFSFSGTSIIGRVSPRSPRLSRVIFLDEASVTATENALLFAATLPQTTIIQNAACEPHVVDMCQLLTQMGAKISGLGTNTLSIRGVRHRRGATFSVSPDYMDAATFAVACAVTGGSITVSPVRREDLTMILLYLSRFGVKYSWTGPHTLKIHPSNLRVDPERFGVKQKFQTRPWPGFPTDLMSPLIVLATQTAGTVLLHDWMYEARMFFVDRLILMGANITLCDPHRVIVTGHTPLYGRHLPSPDIRAGMSLLIAALAAQGHSEIDHVEIIERGYEDPVGRLQKLGAKISRVATRHEL